MKLLGKIFIYSKIKVETGLSIGGSKVDVEIGGVDDSVIKNAQGVPYIPGSSLKGKLRSLLEIKEGQYSGKIRVSKKDEEFKDSKEFKEKYEKILKENIHRDSKEKMKIEIIAETCQCRERNCPICNIFGVSASSNATPIRTRLYVRDCALDMDHFEKNKEELFKNLEFQYTEVKAENTIDRITSTTKGGLRQFERVPAGAIFDSEMVYNLFEEEDIENFKHVLTAMKLLEDDYLGGNGSRGYGRIAFTDITIYIKTVKDYEEDNQSREIYYKKALKESHKREIIDILEKEIRS